MISITASKQKGETRDALLAAKANVEKHVTAMGKAAKGISNLEKTVEDLEKELTLLEESGQFDETTASKLNSLPTSIRIAKSKLEKEEGVISGKNSELYAAVEAASELVVNKIAPDAIQKVRDLTHIALAPFFQDKGSIPLIMTEAESGLDHFLNPTFRAGRPTGNQLNNAKRVIAIIDNVLNETPFWTFGEA